VLFARSQQRNLKRQLARAARASRRHAKQAQSRLERLAFLQPDRLRVLRALATDVNALYTGVAALPPLDPTDADVPGLEPGKRQWEVGKGGYLNWASAKLVQRTQGVPGGSVLALADTSAEDVRASTEEMAVALRELERED
jgi:kinetochore protein Mis12/MTW1